MSRGIVKRKSGALRAGTMVEFATPRVIPNR
jgi:hypothetical protein